MTQILQTALPFAILFEEPKPVLEIKRRGTQLLFGETFEVQDQDGPFLKGRCSVDDYEGWVHADSFTHETWLPTHFVEALWAPVLPHATTRNWAMLSLPFLSRIEIDPEKSEEHHAFIPALRGYIHKNHIRPLADLGKDDCDFVETALRFIEAPYQYNGRSYAGIDCASLVQLALLRAGIPCPNDTDQQEPVLGKTVDFGDPAKPKDLQRGDLVYTKGHVGMMVDEDHILNATDRIMGVQTEKLSDFIQAYEAQGTPITSVRRLPAYSAR